MPWVCHVAIEHKPLTLGEVLDGDRMAKSLYELQFEVDVPEKVLCSRNLSTEDLEDLSEAIEDLYYFEFVIDDVPVRGFVGHLDEEGFFPHVHRVKLWTHINFMIEHNDQQIVFANVSTPAKSAVEITDVTKPLPVTFTYSVQWLRTTASSANRGQKLKQNSFFPRTLEIHWLSVINSMVLVLLLVGFVIVILMRVLKHDFARYNEDEEADDADQENGWKIIRTDVFRFPACKSLLCSILGVGMQFLTLGSVILIMALLGIFNVHRHGQINAAAIVLYAFTSCVSGYVSANMYHKLAGENWVWNINLTSSLFAVPLFIVWSVANSVAWFYGSTQALPWTTIVLLMAFWLFIGYPLTIIGGIFGRNFAGSFDSPCRTKNIAREIPPVPWYRSAVVECVIGGFLPFSAISVELYYIFATLWGREQYTLWGILAVVYVMLLLVTASITVALMYFQLNAEDYRWWWRSLFSAGATSLFVFCYAVFFFYQRSNMSGVLQSVQFFGYTFLTCYVFFLTLGTVGFFSSLKFIRYIYTNVKMD